MTLARPARAQVCANVHATQHAGRLAIAPRDDRIARALSAQYLAAFELDANVRLLVVGAPEHKDEKAKKSERGRPNGAPPASGDDPTVRPLRAGTT